MISIVVPEYNEELVIGAFIEAVKKEITTQDYELLIVNDGSADSTQKIVEKHQKSYPQLRLVNHPKNQGLGAALRTGFREAKGDVIVTLDSDLTHPPRMIQLLASKITSTTDVCIASRYVPGGGMEGVPLWRVALSVAANRAFQLLFFTRVRDITAGFKAYKSSVIKQVQIKRTGFAVQLEIMVRLIKMGCRFTEVPLILTTRQQGHGQSKFKIFKMIPKYFVNILQLFAYRWFG
jgi:dolichol-phosphate mannosyltransferase